MGLIAVFAIVGLTAQEAQGRHGWASCAGLALIAVRVVEGFIGPHMRASRGSPVGRGLPPLSSEAIGGRETC